MSQPSNLNLTSSAAERADQAHQILQSNKVVERLRSVIDDDWSFPLVTPSVEVDLSTNPTHQDTLVIGGDTYEFINTGTGTVVADDSYIAVEIGGGAQATLDALIAAINRTAAAHATVTKADAVTPAEHIGNEAVWALDGGSQVLRLILTYKAGQDPTSTPGSVAPSDNFPGYALFPKDLPDIGVDASGLTAAVAFEVTNFNELDFYNPVRSDRRQATGFTFAVTTEMLAAGFVRFSVPGTVGFQVTVRTSAGAPKYVDGCTWVLASGVLTLNLGTAGAVDPVAGDVVTVVLFGG